MTTPPMRSSFSKTVTLCPAQFSCWAAARPAGPEPTTATLLPVLFSGGGGLGATQPSSKARLIMESSISLMVTGSSLIVSTHAGSHPAIHAARGLVPEIVLRHRLVNVAVVLDALDLVALRGGLAPDLQEPLRVAHYCTTSSSASWRSCRTRLRSLGITLTNLDSISSQLSRTRFAAALPVQCRCRSMRPLSCATFSSDSTASKSTISGL